MTGLHGRKRGGGARVHLRRTGEMNGKNAEVLDIDIAIGVEVGRPATGHVRNAAIA